jgi:hypothetical protein
VTGLAAAMLALAVLMAPGVVSELRHWDALGEALRAVDVAFLAAASVLVLAGVWLLLPIPVRRPALFAGSVAALLLGVGQLAGALTGVVPCAAST